MKIMSRKSISLAVVAGCLSFGCAERPAPVPRMVNDSTSDTGMPEPVALDSLDPAIDEAAQYLILAMPSLPAVKQSKNQLVFAVPPSLEHDSRIPDGRLQSAIMSLRGKLSQNETFAGDFVVISSTEVEANSTLNQIQTDNSSFRDPLQRTPDKTHAEKYDPAAIYLLSGKFYQMTDPSASEREYKLFFKVDQPQTRQEVVRKEIDIHLKWDGLARQWKKVS